MFVRRQTITTLGISLVTALASTACGEGTLEPADDGTPFLSGFHKDSIKVGEVLRFQGRNLIAPTEGRVFVEFDGVYRAIRENGTRQNIPSKFRVELVYEGETSAAATWSGIMSGGRVQSARWNRFGPWNQPFSRERLPGTFEGTIQAYNVYDDGVVQAGSNPTPVALTVEPSIALKRLEPVLNIAEDGRRTTAQCGKPALRGFGGMPYVVEVEAIGFVPESWRYEVTSVNGKSIETFNHVATGARDVLGDPVWPSYVEGEELVFDALPDDAEYGITTITVTAIDTAGDAHLTVLPLSIVRPMQFAWDGARKLAEYYPPVVVHGPIVGAIGTTVVYSESHSESRQFGAAINFGRSFVESHNINTSSDWSEGISVSEESSFSSTEGQSESHGASETLGWDESTSHSEGTDWGMSSTTGTDWSYSKSKGTSDTVSGNTEGGFSIPGITGFKASVGYNHGWSKQETEGISKSTSDSESWGSSTTDSVSKGFSGSYGINNQSEINSSTTESTASSESLTYNIGGSHGISEGYSVADDQSWGETWSNTTSDDSLLAYSSVVPRGRCGVVYRQTVRYVRMVQLYTYDQCGVRSLAGEIAFNEWSWSPNIAIGDDCSTSLPPSTQPKAACFAACN